ncbi:MAG: peptidoglycan-binding protein [Gaiellaceae bacterium]
MQADAFRAHDEEGVSAALPYMTGSMRVHAALAVALVGGLVAAAPVGAVAPRVDAGLNPQLAGLQVALRAQGLYLGSIDARVGPKTVSALRIFQRSHRLVATGRIDAATRKAMGPFGRPLFGGRTISRQMFGWDVAVLQFLIGRQGIATPINGYFDGPTGRAVRAFQRRMGLKSDGIVGPRTMAALGLQQPVPVRAVTHVIVRIYIVKPGDSLTAIGRRFHATVARLAKLNKLDPAKPLLIGTRLRLPSIVKRAAPVSVAASNASSVRLSLDRWSAHYGIDPSLGHALAWMESGYNNSVVSSAGAQGVMQLLPMTWSYVETVLLGHKVQHDADGNVQVGLAYLDHLLHQFGGDQSLALAAWYQGEQSLRSEGMLPESRAFVADVLALKQHM